MSEWFKGGRRIDGIDPDDRGFRYGDGVFETIAIRDGQARLWGRHANRLAAGCTRLGILPIDADAWYSQLVAALSVSGIDAHRATARLVVTAGSSERGYTRPNDASPGVYVEIAPAAAQDDSLYADGAVVRRCATRIGWQPQLAGFKTLNRLDQVLARREWSDESVFEGLMCDRDDNLICGTMSNVFIVQGNRILTPALTHAGVAGVMRGLLIELTALTGDAVIESHIGWQDVRDCDELFLSNSQFGVVPVRRCGDARWPVGARARAMRAALFENGVAEGPA